MWGGQETVPYCVKPAKESYSFMTRMIHALMLLHRGRLEERDLGGTEREAVMVARWRVGVRKATKGLERDYIRNEFDVIT